MHLRQRGSSRKMHPRQLVGHSSVDGRRLFGRRSASLRQAVGTSSTPPSAAPYAARVGGQERAAVPAA